MTAGPPWSSQCRGIAPKSLLGGDVAEILLLRRPRVKRQRLRRDQRGVGVVVAGLGLAGRCLARALGPRLGHHAQAAGDVRPARDRSEVLRFPKLAVVRNACSAPRLNDAERIPPPEQQTRCELDPGVRGTAATGPSGILRVRACGRSVVAAQKPSKLLGRVRFPSPASTATGSGAVW